MNLYDIAIVVLVVLIVLEARDHWYKIAARSSEFACGVSCKHCREEIIAPHDHGNSIPREIADVSNPLYNVRQVAKQLLALESHLHLPSERCRDCIRKHFLTIEMLLEEAITLDRYGRYHGLLLGKPEKIRSIMSHYIQTDDFNSTATMARDLRKEMLVASFNFV